MLARVKLKGIDGGPHKPWIMWFNMMQRVEPHQDLTCQELSEMKGAERNLNTGGAWLSSARDVNYWVQSRNERNPCP
jgi:hypothetical protein